MPPEKSPQSGKREELCEIAQIEIGKTVSLTRKRQHGIRPGFDSAAHQSGEMDAEKREQRIGRGIYEMANEALAVGLEPVIFAAKCDGQEVSFFAGAATNPIAVE